MKRYVSILVLFYLSGAFSMNDQELAISSFSLQDNSMSQHHCHEYPTDFDVNDIGSGYQEMHHEHVEFDMDFANKQVFYFVNTFDQEARHDRYEPVKYEDLNSSIFDEHRALDAEVDFDNDSALNHYYPGDYSRSNVPSIYFQPLEYGQVSVENFHELVSEIRKNEWLNDQFERFNAAELLILGEIIRDGSLEALSSLENLNLQLDYYYPNKEYSVGLQTRFGLGQALTRPLEELVKHIRHIAYNQDGSLRLLTTEQKQELAWVISRYIQFKHPDLYQEILISYVEDGIKEFEIILNIEQKRGFGGAICRAWHRNIAHRKPSVDLSYRIRNNEFNIALRDIKILYLSGRVSEAEALVRELCIAYDSKEKIEVINKFWDELYSYDPEIYKQNDLVLDNNSAFMKEQTADQIRYDTLSRSRLEPFVVRGEKYELRMPARQVLYEFGANEQEFSQFNGTLDQCKKNALLITIINEAADKLSISVDKKEQAFFFGIIDTALIAHELNKVGIIDEFPQFVDEILGQSEVLVEQKNNFLTKIVGRVCHNITNPHEFIYETVTGIGRLVAFTVKTVLFISTHDDNAILLKKAEFAEKFFDLTVHFAKLPYDELETVLADVVGDFGTFYALGTLASLSKVAAVEPVLIENAGRVQITLEESLKMFEQVSEELSNVSKAVKVECIAEDGLKFIANLIHESKSALPAVTEASLPHVISRFPVDPGKIAQFADRIKMLGKVSQTLSTHSQQAFKNATELVKSRLEELAPKIEKVPELVTPEGIKVEVPVPKDSLMEFMGKKGGGGDSPGAGVLKAETMHAFLNETPFGKNLKKNIVKTNYHPGEQKVYKVINKLKEYHLKPGDRLYWDPVHCDHIEVFTKRGEAKCVLNLDGTINIDKTKRALGRTIPI